MKHITPVLFLLTFLWALPLFASPEAYKVADRDRAVNGPVPLLGHSTKPRVIDPSILEIDNKANDAILRGEAQLKSGYVSNAIAEYQSAMEYLPNDPLALQRIAEAYASAGKLAEASQTYYRLFNEAKWQSVGGNPSVYLMYALVLAKTGQPNEAIQFYREGASRIDFSPDGSQKIKVLLPEIVMERTQPQQVRYTPERLQALTDTALAHEEMAFGSLKEATVHMQEAVKLYPDSPVTQYYLGEALLGPVHAVAARAAYQKAIDLGDDQTIAAAKERLTMLH